MPGKLLSVLWALDGDGGQLVVLLRADEVQNVATFAPEHNFINTFDADGTKKLDHFTNTKLFENET